jgi:hypothetical protein
VRGEAPTAASLYLSLLIKSLLALSFPLVLFALRFYDERELRRLGEIWQEFSLVLKHRRVKESWMIIVVSAGAIVLIGYLMVMAAGHPG